MKNLQDYYKNLTKAIITLGLDAIEAAKSGHPGALLGMSDFITILFGKYLKFSPKNPAWYNRDRFVLSNGHASMLLYNLLYLLGYDSPTLQEIQSFRCLGSRAAGHPEFGHIPGVEVTTGPLGQGLANAVGMAIAQKKLEAEFGSDLFNYKVYVTVGDGCLMEGISHEALSLAGHLRLNNLIVLFDSNNITIDGRTSLAESGDVKKRLESYSWKVIEANGHDYQAIDSALSGVQISDRPTLIIFNTVIAAHANLKKDCHSSHGMPLGFDEVEYIKDAFGHELPPFEIAESLLQEWRQIGQKWRTEFEDWNNVFENRQDAQQLKSRLAGDLPSEFDENFLELVGSYKNNLNPESTRKSSGVFLEHIIPKLGNFIGGSADLSESNCLKTKDASVLTKDNYAGNFIHFGIREHAMGAILNGLSCSRAGFVGYGGTFLVFSDYMRPAIRLSALMGLRVIYVMTHDSIGLGEDGPTHQPIEHLASLRAIPNLLVLRPCDRKETFECWKIAIKSLTQPTILVLSRQNLKQLPRDTESNDETKCGAYILANFSNPKTAFSITLIATGSEVEIAYAVAQKLSNSHPIDTRVVSMPSMELFDTQTSDYKNKVLGIEKRIFIEAASSFGWHKYMRSGDEFFGITNKFGESGKANELYKYFGLDAESIYNKLVIDLKLDTLK